MLPLCKLTRTKLYKYAAHFCVESFVRSFPCSHSMELRVFRLLCYVICILCRNAVHGSTLAKVFPSINNTSQPDVKMSEIGSTRARIEHKTQSIETETRPDGITLKDDSSKPETLRESPLVQDLSTKTKILNDSEKAKCYRFVIKSHSNKKLC